MGNFVKYENLECHNFLVCIYIVYIKVYTVEYMNAVELCGSVPPYSVCIYNYLSVLFLCLYGMRMPGVAIG